MDRPKTNTDRNLINLFASPKFNKDASNQNRRLINEMDEFLSNINKYNTKKVDIEQLDKEAKLEAKKCFYEEIDGLKLHSLPKMDEMYGFNKICSQIKKGLKKESIFKNQPFVVFKKEDLYGGREWSEKAIKDFLISKKDKLKMLKTALKMISVETDLDNVLAIKRVVIDNMVSVPIVDVYATLIKILINYGVDLDLMDRFVIKYQNIKDNAWLKRNKPKEENDEEADLNVIQSFTHIVDLIEISYDSNKILDHQLLADFVSIVLILFSEQDWRLNLTCLSSLAHLFACILKRINNSQTTIKLISKTITRFFKDKHALFFEFLDFFPDNNSNLTNIKFALCKIALNKYGIKVGHTEERVNATFNRLRELKSLNNEEIKLVIAFIDHFYKTRDLNDDSLAQQISDRLATFAKEYEFESENQNSIEFRAYLDNLVLQYDRKPKATPKRKKIHGAHSGRPRKIAISAAETKKIWEEIESEIESDTRQDDQ